MDKRITNPVGFQNDGNKAMEGKTLPPTIPHLLPPNKKQKTTHIHDLPDECLATIFSRVGNNPPLPISDPNSETSHDTKRVKHPIQCSFVCNRWRAVTPTAIHSLCLQVNTLRSLPQNEVEGPTNLSTNKDPFRNLTSLTLTRRIVRLPLDPTNDNRTTDTLYGLECFSRHLKTLELLFPVLNPAVEPLARILQTSRTSLRTLRASIVRQDGLLSQREMDTWLEAMCDLPLLSNLTLEFYGTNVNPPSSSSSSPSVWERLGDMARLTEIRIQTDSLPPPSSSSDYGCLPHALRSLFCMNVRRGGSSLVGVGHMTGLVTLELGNADESMTALPACLGHLSRLESLTLRRMPGLVGAPDGSALGRLTALRSLAVVGCGAFAALLPETLGSSLRQLRSLELDPFRGPRLPESLGDLADLETLRLRGATALGALPESLSRLVGLRELEIGECPVRHLPHSLADCLADLEVCTLALPEVEALPEGIGGWVSLEVLDLECPKIAALPEGLCRLGRLRMLFLSRCDRLGALPEGIGRMASLVQLRVRSCPLLESIPDNLGCLVYRDS